MKNNYLYVFVRFSGKMLYNSKRLKKQFLVRTNFKISDFHNI